MASPRPWSWKTFVNHIRLAFFQDSLKLHFASQHDSHDKPSKSRAQSGVASRRDSPSAAEPSNLLSLTKTPTSDEIIYQAPSNEGIQLTGSSRATNPSTNQDAPTSIQTKASASNFFKLPLEIRQRILSYLIDPEDLSPDNITLNLTHRQATALSHVSRQLRADITYLHSQWRKTHNLRDALCPLWTGEDQADFDCLKELIGYQCNRITSVQLNDQCHSEIWRLLQSLDRLRAQRWETRNTIEMQKKALDIRRSVIRELRDENERLVLATEMRDIYTGNT